jgi:hypothetical protein
MCLELVKFKRPYSIAISDNGFIACLIKPTTVKLVLISPNKNENKTVDINEIGLESAHSILINHNNQLVILDHACSRLFWFDQNLRFISSLSLPGKKYGTIDFCKTTNRIYISILDQSRVIAINPNQFKEYYLLFDYSNTTDISSVNGLAYLEVNKFLIIDRDLSSVLIISLDKKEKSINKFLEYGRDGFGKIRHPTDVNLVGELIAVHDNDNYLIQFFNHKMEFKFQIGGKGENTGCFDLPISGFTLNEDLYVCDQNNDRIVKINISNERKCEVVIKDKFLEGSLSRPSGCSFYRNLLFVADRSNHVIQVFDENLKFLYVLNTEDKVLNRPSSISIIKVKDQDILAIVERREGSNCLLNFYSMSADLKSAKYMSTISSSLSFNDPQDMDCSISSEFYIADTLNRRIIKIDLNGRLIAQVGMVKISQNKRILVKCVSEREDGDVFTADFDECIVYHFDSTFKLKKKIDFCQYKEAIKVIRSIRPLKDFMILCVRGKNQVLKVTYSGKIISPLLLKDINWNHPVKICKKSNEMLYIVDKENDRIVKIDNYKD